jgi:PAS domain S-box-containing protein
MHSSSDLLDGDEQSYTITDLIPLEKLQLIQDAFAKGNNVASTLTDTKGVPITMGSNHSGVCTLIRATPKGLENCMRSGEILGRKAKELQQPISQNCYSIGFTDAAAPIVVNGRHIANWLIGQYHVGAVNESRVRDYAIQIGANPQELVRAFQIMPRLTAQEFEDKLNFLGIMANELSQMGYQNLIERRQRLELSRIGEQLERYQGHLEQLVEERTTALREANRQLLTEISQRTKIQKRQARLVTAIESAVESVIITSPSAKIIYVNPAFTDLTGYTAQEAIGKTPKLLKSGHHDQRFYEELWQTITTGRVWKGHFVNRKKDGSIYQEEATISSVKNSKGKIVNYVAVMRDITKEIELEGQLRQAQRLESIGTLAAGVAHEINTPIQYVLGNTQFARYALADLLKLYAACEKLVQAAAGNPAFTAEIEAITRTAEEIDIEYLKEETDAALAQTVQGIDRIAGIVAALKDFSKPGSVERNLEDLNAIINTTVTVSGHSWEALAEMELSLDPSLALVPLLAGRIKQMLLDMILNSTYALARKYGNPPRQKGRISIATRQVGDQVELRIADTGEGIPADVIARIFDPFFTTKEVGQGSGQGLSAARSVIVDNHGGTIGVTSTSGEGAEFTIRLPIHHG